MKKFALIFVSCFLAVSIAGCDDGGSKAEYEGTWNYYYDSSAGRDVATIYDETLKITGDSIIRTMAGTYTGNASYTINSVNKSTKQVVAYCDSVGAGDYFDTNGVSDNTTYYFNYFVDGNTLYIYITPSDTPEDAQAEGKPYIKE